MNLPLRDEFLREPSERVTLDNSYEWEGRSLRLTSLEVKSSQTLLYGEAKLSTSCIGCKSCLAMNRNARRFVLMQLCAS